MDFQVNHEAGRRILSGEGGSLYAGFLAFVRGTSENPLFFMYPPLVAALYAPLGALSPAGAWAVFQALSHLLVLALAFAAHRSFRRTLSADEALAGVGLLLAFFPLQYSLIIGQSEPFVLALLLAGCALRENGRWAAAAACLAAAIQLKLFLALLIVGLALRRDYRCALLTLVLTAAALAAGALFVPADSYGSYLQSLLAPLRLEAFFDNHSLRGFLTRTLTQQHGYGSGLVHAPRLAEALERLLAAGILARYAWTSWRAKAPAGEGLAWSVATALLVAPHADTHHQALLLLPFYLLWRRRPLEPLAVAFYAFFATFEPFVTLRFLDRQRALVLMDGAPILLFGVQLAVLGAFWLWYGRRLDRAGSSRKIHGDEAGRSAAPAVQ